MPNSKRREPRKKRVTVDDLTSSKLADRKQEKVKGGKTPVPHGPIPLPYPNTK
jgi:hypothetical protein